VRRFRQARLIGSYAKGTADRHPAIDLMAITSDDSYEEFHRQRATFLRSLSDLVFPEDWGTRDIAFHIFAHGTEGELYFAREGRLA
jgi:hypothetical protein